MTLSQFNRDLAVMAYLNGEPIHAISASMGVCRMSITRELQKRGLLNWSEEDDDERAEEERRSLLVKANDAFVAALRKALRKRKRPGSSPLGPATAGAVPLPRPPFT